jgi:hypothetical protein
MADNAEQLLELQIKEMQSIGERLRSRMQALWNDNFPSIFRDVWTQLTPDTRGQIIAGSIQRFVTACTAWIDVLLNTTGSVLVHWLIVETVRPRSCS